jgi:hypothetical protein
LSDKDSNETEREIMPKGIHNSKRGTGNPFIFLTQPKIAAAYWEGVMNEFDTCERTEDVDSIWFIYDELLIEDKRAAEAFFEENYDRFMETEYYA